MKVLYKLDTRKKNSDGTYTLKAKIYKDRENVVWISLKIPLTENQWDGKSIVNHDEAKILNARLAHYKINIAQELLNIDMEGNPVSMTEVRSRIEKAMGTKAPTPSSFHTYFANHIETIKKNSTKSTYELAFKNILAYDSVDRGFPEINNKWLKGFEKFCLDKGLSVNSTAIYLRNLRNVYNCAIDDGIANLGDYPFRRFKIKKEATPKRSLTLEQLKTIRDYDCLEHQKQYRDMFMLIFYLCGINMIDLYGLTKITNGRIEYHRAKTGRLYSIKVEPEAMELIEKYKGQKKLLYIADKYTNYKDYLHRVNQNLQEIGPVTYVANNTKPKGNRVKTGPEKRKYNGLFPDMTSYWARHTWATIAARLDIPKETIAAALGHGGNTVTDIYIDFDQKKVDEANRKVLDALK